METTTANILNVTLLEPRQKHPTIFARYDDLQEGESLTIHNDHDPKPLYYQLLGERGNVFTWEYLEEGPEWWKVKIRKRISGENEETLGELTAKDLRKAEVFKKYGLDFSCGGKRTVKEACAEKGLDVTKVEQELQQVDKAPAAHPIPYNEWNIGFLADYITNTHHLYIRKNLPDIVAYAQKVMEVHSDRHPELIEINARVQELNTLLNSRIDTDEKVIFPKIKSLANQMGSGELKSVLKTAEKDFAKIGEKLDEIRMLSQNYTLPEDACASYTLLFQNLNALDEDMRLHIHLENNILFPKALDTDNQTI